MSHLGSRISALLDGQLSTAESERAWEHVHLCHACRDLVEREGQIKTSLAGLSLGATSAPEHLKGALLGSLPLGSRPGLGSSSAPGRRSYGNAGLVAVGGGAVGAAFLGVLALGVAPSDAPSDRRPPTTSLTRHTDGPYVGTPVPTIDQRRQPTR